MEESQDVKDVLLESHGEYRRLDAKHHQLDHRLHKLSGKSHLSEVEQREEATLKKKKLLLKDRMAAIAREYRPRMSRASASA